MNRLMRSCVSLISFVRLSSGRFSTFSSCGFIWMTTMPNSVLSSCMARKALAKLRISGERDSMASLNSFGVGMVDAFSGIVSSSLFCTIAACLGSKVEADAMRPTSTSKELNCRALDTSDSLLPDCSENLCESQACRYLSPPNCTFVEALSGNCMGCGRVLRAARVTIGAPMFESPPGPAASSSTLTVPSGACNSERRTAKQKGAGA
mmetsp:Transcript_65098/g.180557  ORF Transcript_65098/g.180557 Transcript_65098/m.180557 type:complete len:207 (+) Transcript_65098:598-1218(+)